LPGEEDEIRRTALKFLQSSFIESGEIKTGSSIDPDDWERPASSRLSLHDVLDDLELKTNIALRAEKGWRLLKLLLKDGSEIPRQLAHTQPFYIIRRKEALEVYYIVNESLGRIR
jgi:hypothetical protein